MLGCGGSAEVGGNAGNASTGGATNINGGVASATGGIAAAYYGVRATGGASTTLASTAGASTTLPNTGGASASCPATEPETGSRCSGNITCSYGRGIDCAYPCNPGCTPVAVDGSPLKSGFSARSVCLNGTWSIVAEGDCATANDCQCGTADDRARIAQLEASCEASGGEVSSSQCCTSTGDFPRTCNSTGACGCGPGYTKETLQCNCPDGCFDGTSCIRK